MSPCHHRCEQTLESWNRNHLDQDSCSRAQRWDPERERRTTIQPTHQWPIRYLFSELNDDVVTTFVELVACILALFLDDKFDVLLVVSFPVVQSIDLQRSARQSRRETIDHCQTLFKAITKGVFLSINNLIDSRVCGSIPCIRSTTRMAKSHSDEPRDRRFLKDSWPGVSMINNPGTMKSPSRDTSLRHIFVRSRIVSKGTLVAPICCVIPPASPSWTCVRRRLSRIFVLPVSTWPRTQMTGARRTLLERRAS